MCLCTFFWEKWSLLHFLQSVFDLKKKKNQEPLGGSVGPDEPFAIRKTNALSSAQANGSGAPAADTEMALWVETVTREQEKVKLPSGPTAPQAAQRALE